MPPFPSSVSSYVMATTRGVAGQDSAGSDDGAAVACGASAVALEPVVVSWAAHPKVDAIPTAATISKSREGLMEEGYRSVCGMVGRERIR